MQRDPRRKQGGGGVGGLRGYFGESRVIGSDRSPRESRETASLSARRFPLEPPTINLRAETMHRSRNAQATAGARGCSARHPRARGLKRTLREEHRVSARSLACRRPLTGRRVYSHSAPLLTSWLRHAGTCTCDASTCSGVLYAGASAASSSCPPHSAECPTLDASTLADAPDVSDALARPDRQHRKKPGEEHRRRRTKATRTDEKNVAAT